MINVIVPAWPEPKKKDQQKTPAPTRRFRLCVTGLSAGRAYAYFAFAKGPNQYPVARMDPSPHDPIFEFRRIDDTLEFYDAAAIAGQLAQERVVAGRSFIIDLEAWQVSLEDDVTRSLRVLIEETTANAPTPLLTELRFVEGEVAQVDSDCTERVKGLEWIVTAPMRITFQ